MMLKKIITAFVLALAVLFFMSKPVWAIGNPDDIAFYCVGSTPIYKVFYNVAEEDDMLFVAEQYVHYNVTPTDYTAHEAFLFEVINVAGNETIASTVLRQYEAKPISIYMSADQVTAAGISVGDALTIRITGNPLIFSSQTGNTISIVMDSDDYVDQLLGDDGGIATSNNLRNFMIGLAEDLEDFDSPVAGDEYLTVISGVKYLTIIGGVIFLEGVPNLDFICPILFQYASTPMPGDEPETTGAYGSMLTPLAQWGSVIANGLTDLGVYLGINQQLAGSLILLGLATILAVYVYSRTQSGISILLLVGTVPFIGSWLGLMPIALAFIFTILIVVLMGFFFFSRGAL